MGLAMNWDDMRFFLALCREGSVTGAGRSLGVNHTTVSRRINALEERLGTRLFEHLSSGWAMTQSAENMYQHALAMEERAHTINREVFGQDAELKGPLKLTVSHDVADRLIIPRLPEFQKTYPCIDLDIMTTTGLVDLAAREADIAVRLTNKPPDYLIGRQVLPLRHGVYGAPEYLANLKSPANVILFRGGDARPEWVAQHFPDAVTVLRVDDINTMLAAVRSGMGLARMPCYVGDHDSFVHRIDVFLKPSDWGIWVLSHVDLRSTERVRVCREFLLEIIEQQRELVLGEASIYSDVK